MYVSMKVCIMIIIFLLASFLNQRFRWSFTEVRERMNLLKSSARCSVFWTIKAMLLFSWSRYVLQFPTLTKNAIVTVPSAPITIGITVTFVFLFLFFFFRFLARSKYSIFFCFLSFAGWTKSTFRLVHFFLSFLFFVNCLVIWLLSDDLFIYWNER